jgi:small subunit ribosomal protein S21
MRYNKYNKNFHKKKDKYMPKNEGMTVTVRQVKDKDGNVTSDVNGALRVLKKKLMKDGFFQELRERGHFTSKGEKKRKAKAAGKRRYLKKIEKRKQELGY